MGKSIIKTVMALLAFMCCTGTSAAQSDSGNRLRMPDTQVQRGKTAAIPIIIDNIEAVGAFQFDIEFPSGIVPDGEIDPAPRSEEFDITMRNMGASCWRVLGYSASDKPMSGNNGIALYIHAAISMECREGDALPVIISDAVLSEISGAPIVFVTEVGKITIAQSPDLEVSDVTFDKKDASPGDSINISYRIKNIGGLPTETGWSENVVLTDGHQTKTVFTLSYPLSLAAGESVEKTIKARIPDIPLMHGPCTIRVNITPDKDCGEPSSAIGNNTASSDRSIEISPLLSLTPETNRITEGRTLKLRCKATRSGNPKHPLNLTVEKDIDDSRLTIPEAIQIPAGQSSIYFDLSLTDNDLLDTDSICHVAISAEGYTNAQTIITIIDDELPSIILSSSKEAVTEGDSILLTATAQRAPKADLPISLYCDLPERFAYPLIMTLPAGETSVTAKVSAIDNKTAENPMIALFEIAAEGYECEGYAVDLLDNDMPDIRLTLSADTISESQGANALYGKITRMSLIDERVSVILSDNSNGRLALSGHSMIFKPGETEKHFSIDVKDNDIVDNDDTYEIAVSVYLQTCGCQASRQSAGTAYANVIIIDDDSNSLKITPKSKSWTEGSRSNIITISHNVGTTDAVEVSLSCSDTSLVNMPHKVTIPAGANHVDVKVDVNTNTITDDEYMLTIMADAPGFAQGRNWARIVDFSRPDAIIRNLSLSDSIATIGSIISADATVYNDGVATMPTNTLVRLHIGSYSANAYTRSELNPGEQCVVTINTRIPDKVGLYDTYASVNENSGFAELDSLNNRSSYIRIKAISGVSATVNTDKTVYDKDEIVKVQGIFSGRNTAGREMNLYIANDKYRQTIPITTDADGKFTYSFKPYESQKGTLRIGACYPGDYICENETTIQVYGLEGSLTSSKAEIDQNETSTIKLRLNNPTSLPVTGVKVQALNVPENCELSIGEISGVEAGAYAEVPVRIKGLSPSEGNEWYPIQLLLSADNGISLSRTIYYYCHTLLGNLYTDFQSVNTSVAKGSYRDYTVNIQNRGKGETGAISLALPDVNWIESLTPLQLPSLQSGKSTNIRLRLHGSEKMELNVTYRCSVGINCTNSDGLLVQFATKTVSDTKGKLIVDVCDEYTYSTEGNPRVADASVSLRDPSNGTVMYTGKADDSGRFIAEVPQGFYTLNVSAPQHDEATYSIEVLPEQETRQTANISVRGVDISYEVTKDVITETYEVKLKTKFETNVPVPVVVMEGPTSVDGDAMAVGESMILDYTLTNHGLIEALNVYLQVPTGSDEFTLEPLTSVGPFNIAANESVKMPLLLTRISNGTQSKAPARAQSRAQDDLDYNPDWLPKTNNTYFNSCMAGMAYWYHHNCGGELKDNEGALRLTVKACMHGSIGSALASVFGNSGTGGTGTPLFLVVGPGPFPEPDEPDEDPGDINGHHPWYYDPSADSYHDMLRRETNICNPAIATCGDFAISEVAQAVDETGIIASTADAFANGYCNGIINGTEPSAEAVSEAMTNMYNTTIGTLAESTEVPDLENIDDMNDINDMVEFADNLNQCYDGIRARNEAFRELEESRRPKVQVSSNDDFSIIPDWMEAYREAVNAYAEISQLWQETCEEAFGSEIWYTQNSDDIRDLLKAIGRLKKVDVNTDNLADYKPECVSVTDFATFVERVYNTLNHIKGTNVTDIDRVAEIAARTTELENEARAAGFESVSDRYKQTYLDFVKNYREEEESVCATVGIALSQSAAIAREVVRGKFRIYNGNEEFSLRDLHLSLKITDEKGSLSNQKFTIQIDNTEGFDEGGNETDGYTLAPGATGEINLTFVPKTDAGMTEAIDYEFGGVVSYIDPYLGSNITVELYPTVLTINPSPVLDFTYFLQRDIIGDDPLTHDIVEESEPAELALLIENRGYGDVLDMNITTHKPEIIENSKGLAIGDFELIGSKLNDKEISLPIGTDVVTAFGSIPAKGSSFAQWWFKSPILGHFVDYEASLDKDSQFGKEASLIDKISVHELIRSIRSVNDSDSLIVAFLTNDIVDSNDRPDHLYSIDGTISTVRKADYAYINRIDETNYSLTVHSDTPGWVYGNIPDPTNGAYEIVYVTKDADDAYVPERNFWISHVTMRDGKEPLHQNILHFADSISGTVNYTIGVAKRQDENLYLTSIAGINDNATGYVEAFILSFSKIPDTSTFTPDRINIYKDGQVVNGEVEIVWIDDSECQILTASLTDGPGNYELRVSLDGVTDMDGTPTSGIYSRKWTQGELSYIGSVKIRDAYTLASSVIKQSAKIIGDIGKIVSCSIYNASGMLLKEANPAADGSIDFSDMPAGMYVIQINCADSLHILRLIKR